MKTVQLMLDHASAAMTLSLCQFWETGLDYVPGAMSTHMQSESIDVVNVVFVLVNPFGARSNHLRESNSQPFHYESYFIYLSPA